MAVGMTVLCAARPTEAPDWDEAIGAVAAGGLEAFKWEAATAAR